MLAHRESSVSSPPEINLKVLLHQKRSPELQCLSLMKKKLRWKFLFKAFKALFPALIFIAVVLWISIFISNEMYVMILILSTFIILIFSTFWPFFKIKIWQGIKRVNIQFALWNDHVQGLVDFYGASSLPQVTDVKNNFGEILFRF